MIDKYAIDKKINGFAPLGTVSDFGKVENGGKGSGNFGHSGRPGKVGGSSSSGSSLQIPSSILDAYKTSSEKYSNPDKMTIEITPQGNLYLMYEGKGVSTIRGDKYSEETLEYLREQGVLKSDESGTNIEIGSKVKKAMQESFKDYYAKEYPDDYQLAKIKDVSFLDIAKGITEGKDVYEIIGDVDSVIRERAFSELETRSGLDYGAFYDTWLERDTKDSKALQDFLKAF